VAKTPILGKIPKKGWKSRISGIPGGGFTSTPRGGAPRYPQPRLATSVQGVTFHARPG